MVGVIRLGATRLGLDTQILNLDTQTLGYLLIRLANQLRLLHYYSTWLGLLSRLGWIQSVQLEAMVCAAIKLCLVPSSQCQVLIDSHHRQSEMPEGADSR